MRHLTENFFVAKRENGLSGIVDISGNLVGNFEYEDVDIIGKQFIYKKNGKWGLKESKVGYNFDEIKYGGEDGVYKVRIKDKWGYLSCDDKIYIKPQFRSASNFNKGAKITTDEKKDFICNENGELVREVKPLESWLEFSEGMIGIINEEDNMGCIDQFGNSVIDFEYFIIEQFQNGAAICKPKGLDYGIIDKDKNILIPFIYELIDREPGSQDLFAGYRNGIWELFSKDGWYFWDKKRYNELLLEKIKIVVKDREFLKYANISDKQAMKILRNIGSRDFTRVIKAAKDLGEYKFVEKYYSNCTKRLVEVLEEESEQYYTQNEIEDGIEEFVKVCKKVLDKKN